MQRKQDPRTKLHYLENMHDKNAPLRLLNAFIVVLVIRIVAPILFDLVEFDSIIDFLLFIPESALDAAIYTIVNALGFSFLTGESLKEQAEIERLRRIVANDSYDDTF